MTPSIGWDSVALSWKIATSFCSFVFGIGRSIIITFFPCIFFFFVASFLTYLGGKGLLLEAEDTFTPLPTRKQLHGIVSFWITSCIRSKPDGNNDNDRYLQ